MYLVYPKHVFLHTKNVELQFLCMGPGFKADRDNLPWARADGAGHAPNAAALTYNCTLPPGTPMVRGEGEPMSFQRLGQLHASGFDWDAIAACLGDPSLADKLFHVCMHTKWRKCTGRQVNEHPQLSATKVGGRGAHVGPLGDNLAQATCNLVAAGLEGQVNTWPM